MKPFRVYFTPARLLAWRRLYYHLVVIFTTVAVAVFASHTDADFLPLLSMIWHDARVPMAMYTLGFIEISAKTAEEHTDDKPDDKPAA